MLLRSDKRMVRLLKFERRKVKEPHIAVKVRVQQRSVLHLHDLECSGLVGAAEELQLLADPASLYEEREGNRTQEVKE